ncbi:MAG: ABC transporter permease, partial [Gemmatimonadaceae bacterium]
MQQVLTETGLVAGVGAAAGVLLAFYGTRAARLIPAERLPFWTPILMDVRVVALALVLALIGGAVLSIAPVLRLSPARLASGVREPASAPPGRARMRSILVGAEIALSVVLVAVAGILVKQLVAAERADLATAKRSVVFVALATRNGAADASWPDRAIAGLHSLPGVTSVAVSGMPLRQTARSTPRRDSVARRPGAVRRAHVYVEARDEPVRDLVFPIAQVVTRDYFAAVGTPLVAGRAFGATDDASAPSVAIINAGAARRAFGGESPIGRRIRIEAGGTMGDWLTIVGIAADQRTTPFGAQTPRPQLFRPWTQVAAVPATIAVHVVGDSRRIAPILRGALHTIDPSVLV